MLRNDGLRMIITKVSKYIVGSESLFSFLLSPAVSGGGGGDGGGVVVVRWWKAIAAIMRRAHRPTDRTYRMRAKSDARGHPSAQQAASQERCERASERERKEACLDCLTDPLTKERMTFICSDTPLFLSWSASLWTPTLRSIPPLHLRHLKCNRDATLAIIFKNFAVCFKYFQNIYTPAKK